MKQSWAESINLAGSRLQSFSDPNPTSVLQLTGGNTASDDGFTIIVQLSLADVTSVKLDMFLCTHFTNCYINLTSQAITDMAGNVLSAGDVLRAEDFNFDEAAPVLNEFVLNMDTGLLTLYFDEPVQARDLTALTFQDSTEAMVTYQLTGGVVESIIANTQINITLLDTDLNAIKSLDGLATGDDDTYLSATTSLATDAIGNSNAAVTIQVTTYILDMSPVSLEEFRILDLNDGSIELSFSEPVAIGSVNFTQFTLQSMVDNGVFIPLTSGVADFGDDKSVVIISLSSEDILQLKSNEEIGTELSDTFISVSAAAITDVAGSDIEPINGSPLTVLRADFISASLESFELNINMGYIVLTFDDVVDPKSLMASGITIQSDAELDSENSTQYTLTGAVLNSEQGNYTITFDLIETDWFALQANPYLATGVDDTYLSVSANAVNDVGGLSIFPTSIGLPVTTFVEDTTSPVLKSFTLDVDEGLLMLSFSEVVNISSFDSAGLRIQSNPDNTTSSVELGDSNPSSTAPASSFTVELSFEELESIKQMVMLATEENTTYLSVSNSTITDMVGLPLAAIASNNAMVAFDHVADMTPPSLTNYSIDLNNGLLTLLFDETVILSTFNITAFTFQSAPNDLDSTTAITLTGPGTLLMDSSDGTEFSLFLSASDYNRINSDESIARNRDNTYLSVTAGAIMDTNGIPSDAISSSNALQVGEFFLDGTRPTLVSYNLNMNTGRLLLSFSEPVDPQTYSSSSFTFQNNQSIYPEFSYTLTEGGTTLTMEENDTLLVGLPDQDLFQIKVYDIATSDSDTYLSVQDTGVADVFLNYLVPIKPENALRVNIFMNDITPPEIEFVIVNLETSQIQLNISEPIEVESFNISQIRFTNDPQSPTAYHVLTGGTLAVIDLTTVIIMLNDEDATALKTNPNLANDLDTFIAATAFSFSDRAGVRFTGISVNNARQVDNVIPDTSPPRLESFNYEAPGDRAGVVLVLQFSEVINASTFDPTAITLQNESDIAVTTVSFTLSDAIYNLDPTTVLHLNVTDDDYNEILSREPLGQSRNTTYLSITDGAVKDVLDKDLIGTQPDNAIRAAVYTVDLEPPEITEYTFNLNTAQIIVSFTEAILSTSFNSTGFTLQNHFNASEASFVYTLTDSTATSSRNTITIDLSPTDLDVLNINTEIATSNDTTYISISESSFTDSSNNPVVSIPNDRALAASVFVSDTSGPALESFRLVLDTRQLILTFSETLNISTLNVSAITMQNAAQNSTEYFTLNGGHYYNIHSSIVVINITELDFYTLQTLTDLGNSPMNTFISHNINIASDLYGHSANPISSNNALKAYEVSNDTVHPELFAFDYDMNSGLLTLSFSEVVDINSFQADQLTFQNIFAVPTMTYTLQNSSVVSQISDIIDIQLNLDDLNNLKAEKVCLVEDMCYIAYSDQLITDTSGLSVVPRLSNAGLDVDIFIEDTTRPELRNFASFDLNLAQFSLEFSETVDTATLSYSGITIQSFASDPEDTFSLTSGDVTDDGSIITITLSTEDAITLKQNPFLCGRQGTCYISVTSAAIKDMSGNDVEGVPNGEAPLVEDYTGDETSPTLESFDLDMNVGILTLTFDEIVDTRELMLSGLVITSSLGAISEFYRLSDGTQTSNVFSDEVTIELSTIDLNGIKATEFAKSKTTTYLTIEPMAITDLSPSQNAATMVTLQVDQYTDDNEDPTLISYHLDMDENILIFTFSEPMKENDLRVSGISLHNAANGGDIFDLTGGDVTSTNQRTIVTIAFSSQDLIDFKIPGIIATTSTNTFVSVDSSTVSDTDDNFLEEIQRLAATTTPNQYTPDTSRMKLISFTLDIFNGDLFLTFDDVADVSTFVATGIIVQDAQTSSNELQLSDESTSSSNDGLVVVVDLAAADVLALTNTTGLATRVENTFIILEETTIDGLDGEDVVLIFEGDALQAYEVIGGGNGTQLTSFKLDMDSEILQLFFSQQVDANSFKPELIIIQDATGASSVVLTGGTATSAMIGLQVNIELSEEDVDIINADEGLGTGVFNTYISLEGAFVDNGAVNVTTPDGIPLQVTEVTADNTSPELISYTLDLNSGEIRFTFSETVLVNSIDPTLATLHDLADLSSSSFRYTLAGGSAEENAPMIDFSLVTEDLNALKNASLVGQVYITLEADFIRDAFSNRLVPVHGERSEFLVSDVTDPMLDSFILDLDTSTLILTFNEIVSTDSIDLMKFSLQAEQDDNTVVQTFSNSYIATSYDSDVITVRIAGEDRISLTCELGLGVSIENTYIAVDTDSVADKTLINFLSSIPTSNAFQATAVVEDNTSPLLTNWSFDRNASSIHLTFDECINLTTVNLDHIIIQSASFSPDTAITLTVESEIPTGNSAIVDVMLSTVDADALLSSQYVGTSISNTFLNLTSGAVSDVSGNLNTEFHEAISPQELIQRTTTPILVHMTLDLCESTLILSYTSAINIDRFTLENVTIGNGMESFQLTSGGSQISPNSGSRVTIDISGDLNPHRESMIYGISEATTLISIEANTAFDFSVPPRSALVVSDEPVDKIIVDSIDCGPILISSILDLNDKKLLLVYEETVNVSTFNPTHIMLQDAHFDAIEMVAITSNDFDEPLNFSTVVLRLNQRDVDELNLRPELATNINDTYISIMANAIQDLLGNPAPAISVDSAQQIGRFYKDTMNPSASAFQIDLNTNTITIRLNEVGNPLSVNMTQLTVQDSASNPSSRFTFSGLDSSTQMSRTTTIELTQTDVDQLNALPLCKSVSNCFANISSGFISDAAGNEVISTVLQASNFTNDTTIPEFSQFRLMDVDSGIMLLQFTETIDADSLQIDSLRLQSTADGSGADFTMFTLTGGEILSGSSSEIEVKFLQADLNDIKLNTLLCTRRTDCYIRYSPDFAADAFGNALPPLANQMENSQHYPLMYVEDSTGPVLTSFNLDLESSILELSFNEYFQISSFDPRSLTFQDAPIANASYSLTGGSVISFNDTGLIIELLSEDMLSIKASPIIAISSSTVYIVNTASLATDASSIGAFERQDGINALKVNAFVEDNTNPTFVSFEHFNRENAELSLKFSEPIDVTRVNYSDITFQSEQNDGGISLQLDVGEAELDPSDLTILVITLSFDDQFTLRQMNTLGVSEQTSFVAFGPTAFVDTAGNSVDEIPTSNAEMAARVTLDFFPPQLDGFELNMEDGLITLTYDDIIQPMVYSATGITIHNATNFGYTLTGGVSLSNESLGFILPATITLSDLLQLKYILGLATGIDDTYVSATGDVTQSSDGTPVLSTTAVQATSFIPDQTRPNVTGFSLNLTTEILTLLADEPLDPASFNGAGVTLQNSPNSTGIGISSVTLSGGIAMQTDESIYLIDITLTTYDLNRIKQIIELATTVNNVYLSLDSIAIADFGANGVFPISGMKALDTNVFGTDLIAPKVSHFTLDMDAGEILMTFTEVVRVDIFDPSSIALQTSSTIFDESDAFVFIVLSQLTTDAINNLSGIIRFGLEHSDLNQLKLDEQLGEQGTTFATFDAAITIDSNNHELIGAPNGSAIEVDIVPDTSGPVAESYTIDLDSGTLSYTFDEPVEEISVTVEALSIPLPSNHSFVFTLSQDVTVTQVNANDITVSLPLEELLDLLEFVNGESLDVVYFTSDFVSDIFGNPVSMTGDLVEFFPDETPPYLDSFNLDMNTGLLELNFSEAIQLESFNPSGVVFQNDTISTSTYTLTSNSTFLQKGPRSIEVQIGEKDLNGIKAAPNLGTATENTFISITSDSVSDLFSNGAQQTPSGEAVQVSGFIEDQVPPEFVSFTFGAINGRVSLSLTFTEVIDYTSVQVSQIRLSDELSEMYVLLSSQPLAINSDVITIPLSTSDLDFILTTFMFLGQYRNSTYITFTGDVAADSQSNQFEFTSDPIQASNEPGDLVPPELESFTLNLNTGIMTLTFSETIQEDSFDLSHARIQSLSTGGAGYSLTNGTVVKITNISFMVFLSSNDVNSLQALVDVGTTTANTYISIELGFASDIGDLYVLPTTLEVSNLTRDQNPPLLVGFELSLSGSEPMTLTFSETVIASTLQIDRVFLLSEASSTAVEFGFTDWEVLSSDGPVIEIQLSIVDKGRLQQLPDLATSIENTFIRVTEGAITDPDGFGVVGLSRNEAIQASAFTPDVLPPSIVQFTIDMDSGLIVLNANEPVDGTSFVSGAYRLQNSATQPSASYNLTEQTELIRITDFTSMTVAIGDEDLNLIKAFNICTINMTCFLTYEDGAIADTFGEEAVNITTGLSPLEFTADTTEPQLQSFDVFNRATGTANLTFTETILSSSFNASGVTLQSFTSGQGVTSYTLNGGRITASAPTITLTLTDDDMVDTRLNPFLCTSRGNCYITLEPSTLTDIAGNLLRAESNGILVDTFSFDDHPPILNIFTLDMDNGELTLTFSEPVSADVFNVEGISLQDAALSPNNSYKLSSESSTSSENGVEIVINLSNTDLNHIKASQLATNNEDTFLTPH